MRMRWRATPVQGSALLRIVMASAYVMIVLSWALVSVVPASAVGQLVQQSPVSIVTSNASSVAATLPTAATAGNLLVVVCGVNGASNITVTGYAAAAGPTNGTVSQGIFYKIATGGETTATCTSSLRTRNGLAAHMYEYSGMNTLSTVDTSGTAGGTGTAVSSGAATPTSTSSLVFAAFTAAGGTTFTGVTAGYTKRADSASTIHVAAADTFTSLNTAQTVTATNSASAAWRGHIVVFKVAVGSKWADIVDAAGNSVASPSVGFPATTETIGCNMSVATLGTGAQKIRVSNTTPSPTWSLTLAATGGPTGAWNGGGGPWQYDYNDPTLDGCVDGADADSFAGKMIVNPSSGTVTPVGVGCTATGITLGAQTGFSEATQDSVTLVTAGVAAPTNCMWDFTGLTLTQYIPAEQRTGTYSLSLTITLLAS